MGPLILACVVAATVPSTSPSLPSVDQFADRHQSAPQDAAVVVGIEKYFVVDHVPYAARDAQAFWSFLVFDRGVLPERISFLKHAPAIEQIEQEVEKRAAQVGPGGTLWFYFAGHGAPDPSGKDGLLVGVDAQQTVESVRDRSVSRRWLLDALGKSHAQHVLVFLDACFSGNGRDGHPLAQDLRPLLPTAALGTLAQGAVLTGARSDEVSGPLDAAKHGLFTYFLLGALRGWGEQDPSGPVTVESAFSYLRKAMGAALANGDRQQEPDLSAPQDAKIVVLAQGLGEQGPDLSALSAGEATATTDRIGMQEPGPAIREERLRASAPPPRFEVAGDGTVRDTKTGLVWQRTLGDNSRGQSWSAAQSYCGSLALAGGGWRVPTLQELSSLLDLAVAYPEPKIDTTAFPGTPNEWFWTSSPLAGDSSYAWVVSFSYGYASYYVVGITYDVRCVR